MFEKLTLAGKLEQWIGRGWKLGFTGLPDPTVEVVLYRKSSGARSVLDFEILEATRVAGIADCLNRVQIKWGTQVRATDPTQLHSIQRGIREILGWEMGPEKFKFVGIVGPWIHRATVELVPRVFGDPSEITLNVQEEQGEETCFSGTLFCANATGFELGEQGAYLKAMENTRWVNLRNLIQERGQDASCLYWSMLAYCLFHMNWGKAPPHDRFIRYIEPGKYHFLL